MLYNYTATTEGGEEQAGSIDAANIDIAIGSLQSRGFIITNIEPADQKPFLKKNISLFDRVSNKEIVILSRQIATLFEASVSVLNAFQLLASETSNAFLQKTLSEIASDIESGVRISMAMARHPKIFSSFYVNMVKAGEESGKLSETFNFLADSLERTYELVRKAKNAMIYPIFVIVVFIAVMILMMVVVIPQLSGILIEAGQDLPVYTKVIIGTSNFFLHYGVYLLVLFVAFVIFVWRYNHTKNGAYVVDQFRLSIPYVGNLYKKLYLSRISDNLDTMLTSGISMIKSLEITVDVVNSPVYQGVMNDVIESVKGGSSLAEAFSNHDEIPPIIVQMSRIGEETGKLGFVLKTMSRFYRREVESAVDSLVGLIEPIMIILLGLGVGVMLAGVLLPIYSLTAAI